MRNPQNLLIAVLLFLLLGSLGGIYYINKQYEEAKNEGLQKVKVFVSDRNISDGQLITEKDIKIIELPKSAVSFRPLQKGEIIGKYAKTPIFQNEPILAEKISAKLQAISDANLSAQFDKFNMRFALFQNPNFNLKKGERIDIIGVYKNNVDPNDNNFAVGYAARNIKILDFLKNGLSQQTPSTKNEDEQKESKDPKGKKAQKVIFADELILDMRGDEIAKTLSIMNKNHQIWMVLSSENRGNEALIKIKSEFMPTSKPIRQTIKETVIGSQPPSQTATTQAPIVVYETDANANAKK